jgi:hypothetical protein
MGPGDVGSTADACRAAVVLDQRDSGDQEHEGKKYRREEHPAPVDRGEHPADHEPERKARRPRSGVDQKRLVALRPFGELRRDDRKAGRRQESGGHAGDEPRDQQHPAFGREPPEAGEKQEDCQPQQEHSPPAEKVRLAPTQQHEAAVTQHIGAHDPAECRGGQAEVGADRRQRHVERGHVDTFEWKKAL